MKQDQSTSDEILNMKRKYPCPMCDSLHQYFEQERYETCKICGWVDCVIQRHEPDNTNGANPVSFNEAKKLWHLGESIYPEFPNNTRRVFIIDGNRFRGIDGFYCEMDRLFTNILGWKSRHDINVFGDLLHGGYGVHESGELIKIIWINFAESRRALGYTPIIRNLESLIARYDKPRFTSKFDKYGVGEMKSQLEMARSGKVETMADYIVSYILEQENCVLEIIE